MSEPIAERFRHNAARVRRLVALHDAVPSVAGAGPGDAADVLRSAVVFLHAALEDLVRNLVELRLPHAGPDVLRRIPLAGLRRGEKFTLGELARFRGATVGDVIRRSVDAHLATASYGNMGDILIALDQAGIEAEPLHSHRGAIAALMARRHLIVHRADLQTTASGHAHRPLARGDVVVWIEAVEAAGDALAALAS